MPALTVLGSNTPTRWSTTRRSPRRSRKSCRRKRTDMKPLVIAFLLVVTQLARAGTVPAGFTEHDADVNRTRIHYYIGGKGSPVVLLHGYAQTGHMWNPIVPLLSKCN